MRRASSSEPTCATLDLPRSALLAGMIRNPGGYNPRGHPREARERRNLVLGMMEERGTIDAAQLGRARAAPLGTAERREVGDRSPWVEDYLADAIARFSPEAVPSRSGHSVFTTFDPAIQHAAEEALSAGIERIERRLGRAATGPPEGAIVVLRPADGALLALVGGRDHTRSQYNRATQARRPPGSTFKPFVFLAGLERARNDPSFDFDAATVLDDEPLMLQAGGRPWTPSNFDRRYRGQVTVRETLEQSINVPTVRAALDIGLDRVVEVARRCGIESELQAVPALALGAEEVTPLELSAAYAALANGGSRVVPHGIVGLLDRDGTPIEVAEPQIERAVDKVSARRITDMLEGVLEHGTASSADSLGFPWRRGGEDRDDQRPTRRLVRRLHTRSRGHRMGRLRRQPPAWLDRRRRRTTHLGRRDAAHRLGGRRPRAKRTGRLLAAPVRSRPVRYNNPATHNLDVSFPEGLGGSPGPRRYRRSLSARRRVTLSPAVSLGSPGVLPGLLFFSPHVLPLDAHRRNRPGGPRRRPASRHPRRRVFRDDSPLSPGDFGSRARARARDAERRARRLLWEAVERRALETHGPATLIAKPAGAAHANSVGSRAVECLVVEVADDAVARDVVVCRSARIAHLAGRLRAELVARDDISSLAMEELIRELLAEAAPSPRTRPAEPKAGAFAPAISSMTRRARDR
jgi:hypothetical protein